MYAYIHIHMYVHECVCIYERITVSEQAAAPTGANNNAHHRKPKKMFSDMRGRDIFSSPPSFYTKTANNMSSVNVH